MENGRGGDAFHNQTPVSTFAVTPQQDGNYRMRIARMVDLERRFGGLPTTLLGIIDLYLCGRTLRVRC